MIFVGLIIGVLFGCWIGFAVASQPEYRSTRRVRYRPAKPMLPRKWDTDQ